MKTTVKMVNVVAEAMSESDLRSAKGKNKKSRMYFTQIGETPEGAQINVRPKVLFRGMFDDIFAQIGEKPTKVNFDKLAGCHKEATAPGFVLDGIFNKNIRVEYKIELEPEPEVTPKAEKVAVEPKAEKPVKKAAKRSHKAKAKKATELSIVPVVEEQSVEATSEVAVVSTETEQPKTE